MFKLIKLVCLDSRSTELPIPSGSRYPEMVTTLGCVRYRLLLLTKLRDENTHKIKIMCQNVVIISFTLNYFK